MPFILKDFDVSSDCPLPSQYPADPNPADTRDLIISFCDFLCEMIFSANPLESFSFNYLSVKFQIEFNWSGCGERTNSIGFGNGSPNDHNRESLIRCKLCVLPFTDAFNAYWSSGIH